MNWLKCLKPDCLQGVTQQLISNSVLYKKQKKLSTNNRVRSDLQAALLLEARCAWCQRWPQCRQKQAHGPGGDLEEAGTGRGTDTVSLSLQSRGQPLLSQQTHNTVRLQEWTENREVACLSLFGWQGKFRLGNWMKRAFPSLHNTDSSWNDISSGINISSAAALGPVNWQGLCMGLSQGPSSLS